MSNDLFYSQLLVLYLLINIFIIYLTYVYSKKLGAQNTSYPIYIAFFLYNIFGLYLLHNKIVNDNSKLSNTTVNFTDSSNANIMNLTSIALLGFNGVLIALYAYQLVNANANAAGGYQEKAAGGGRRR